MNEFISASHAAGSMDFEVGLDAAQRGDFVTAKRQWRPLAEAGNARAQFYLGLMYTRGDGVTEDSIEAVKWYRFAARQGDACAQFHLGRMYAAGLGVSKDPVKANMCYRRAAEQGDARAQHELGHMDNKGDGVAQRMLHRLASARAACD